jgi:hypothetical protein
MFRWIFTPRRRIFSLPVFGGRTGPEKRMADEDGGI